MRILIINYEFPPIGGGAGNASYHIARELTRSGHRVAVMTSRFQNLPHQEEMDGFDIFRIPAIRKSVEASSILEMTTFLFSGIRHASRVRSSFLPDVTLAFFTIPSAPIAAYLKLRWNIPFLTLLRGGDVPGFGGIGMLATLSHSILKPLTRLLWNYSSAVIANSQGLAELARRTWKGLIRVVPNGVDATFFRELHSKPRQDLFTLLFVGRLSPQKGLSEFLSHLMKWQAPTKWQMIVAGDGPEREHLTALASDDRLDGHIEFRGWQTKNELVLLYQSADAFVLPSKDEGMPNVLLEAMACGLPVIVSDIPGNTELVLPAENGFIHRIDDGDELRRSLTLLASKPEVRTQLARKSRQIAEQRSWATVAGRLLGIIESQSNHA